MHPLISSSFDRFARYSHVERVRALLGPEPLEILDVGDPYGTLDLLFPQDRTISLDIYAEEPPRHERHAHVIGSGFDLPFPDDSFDLVTSHDTLEHLPAGRKSEFLAELVRVSRGPVVVVAPFADPRTTRCEGIVNAYYVARFGHEMYQLAEHAASGLPDLEVTLRWITDRGLEARVYSDGWLYHWLSFMLLKAHLISEQDHDTDRRVDTAFNQLLREADRRAPHYRRAVVISPPSGLRDDDELTADAGDVDGDLTRFAQLASELSIALPRNTDPLRADSPLRTWIANNAQGSSEIAVTAKSLGVVLDAVRDLTEPVATRQVSTARTPGLGENTPTVAVVLVNLNGADHLRICLDSLSAQDYPGELEVVVVDNASRDRSLDMLAADYPWVRVLPMETNTGFAPAVNAGVRAVEAQCVVLLNNDARVDRNFVRELVRRYDPSSGAVCVGARILSWDGDEVDFVEGALNYYGMGTQNFYGSPVAGVPVQDGQELLFACGGAMLVDRRTFLDVGGLDPQFFAYFEDVDFGWRLWILGHRVVLATDAVAYHRMHGTSSRFPLHQRYLLYERNALRMIMKNYSDRNLERVLGPALLLMGKRALLRGKLDRAPYDIGGNLEPSETVDRLSLAHLHAIGDVVDDLDEIRRSRGVIQRARRRPDAEVLARFQRPLWPVIDDGDYARASEAVTRVFELGSLFEKPSGSRVLVVSNDGVGERMSGPAIRAVEIAKALAGVSKVTLAVPTVPAVEVPDVTVATFADEHSLKDLADTADVVLFQGYTLQKFPQLARTSAILVADLYDPWLFENIELHTGERGADAALRSDAAVLNELLDQCDFFVCASERQRDYWLGMLSSRGRLTQNHYSTDPTLRHLIDVVPFGLPDRRPVHSEKVLKGVHPGIGADDRVVLWGGGAWDWLDPLTLIEAWPSVVASVPDAKLYFLGLQLNTESAKRMRVAHMATVRAEQLGLTDSSVFFGDWVPYERRESYLLEADIGVSAARDLAETRLSFRTRVLDYLWAGLPTVTTEGDVLSEMVAREGLGLVVSPGDPTALASALIKLLGDPLLRADMADRAMAASERFRWGVSVEPLRRVVRQPWEWERSRALSPRHEQVTEDLRRMFEEVAAWNGNYVSGPAARIATKRREFEEHVKHLEGVVRAYAEQVEDRDARIQDLDVRIRTLTARRPLVERSLGVVRRTPIYPALKRLVLARRSVRG